MMPTGENVLTVSVGGGWAAAATDRQLVRIFSASGLQVRIEWNKKMLNYKSSFPPHFTAVD